MHVFEARCLNYALTLEWFWLEYYTNVVEENKNFFLNITNNSNKLQLEINLDAKVLCLSCISNQAKLIAYACYRNPRCQAD